MLFLEFLGTEKIVFFFKFFEIKKITFIQNKNIFFNCLALCPTTMELDQNTIEIENTVEPNDNSFNADDLLKETLSSELSVFVLTPLDWNLEKTLQFASQFGAIDKSSIFVIRENTSSLEWNATFYPKKLNKTLLNGLLMTHFLLLLTANGECSMIYPSIECFWFLILRLFLPWCCVTFALN